VSPDGLIFTLSFAFPTNQPTKHPSIIIYTHTSLYTNFSLST
jgi:hypothetical protein